MTRTRDVINEGVRNMETPLHSAVRGTGTRKLHNGWKDSRMEDAIPEPGHAAAKCYRVADPLNE
jgi:hypothetical protein